ncbi:hypothetical protein Tco_1331257 [Tanacetum coccineum]
MAEDALFTMSVDTLEEGPSGFDPKESPVGTNISRPYTEDHTPDHTPESASEDIVEDPIMQFVVQNFEQINTMYSVFSSKMKEINLASQLNNNNLPDMRPWNSNPEGLPEWVVQETPEEVDVSEKPYKKNRFITDDSNGLPKQNLVTTSTFYNEPFTFKETEVSIRNLVASPFTPRVRDYDMPDGLKVRTNLKKYDGMSDLDDHLTIFIGTMDVHKLSEPACCRFFHIT